MEFDFAALDRTPSLKERLKAKGAWALKLCLGLVVAFALFGIVTTIAMGGDMSGVLVWGIVAGFASIAAYAAYYTLGRTIQINEFASQNSLTYVVNQAYDQRAGMIFNAGHSRVFPQLLRAEGRDFVELGNYRYTTGSGRSRQVHDFGFMRIKLPRRLPNMVLDSKKNNFFGGRLSNLNVGFGGSQRLSLEGDFDNYFTLYAPEQYKRDALYVFTPDVMQALVEAAHAYDCEVIDDDFYIYSSRAFGLADRAEFLELASIAHKLRSELADQTDYYADERVGDRALNTVASEGARLRTRLSPGAIIGIICFILYLVWTIVLPLF